MAEENDINKKPKATLIKHKKMDSEPAAKASALDDAEKKKVVVVKKKIVKVKKRSSHPDGSDMDEDESDTFDERADIIIEEKERTSHRHIESEPYIKEEFVAAENKEKISENKNELPSSKKIPHLQETYKKGDKEVTDTNKTGRPVERSDRTTGNQGSYQGNRPDNRGTGYQGNRPDNRGAGNQGNRPDNRTTSNQGDRPDNRGTGYQGNRPDNRSTGYQGNRPDNRGTGNQGGYQGNRPDNRGTGSQGGYQGNRPDNRGTGYQGNRPDNRSSGYQGDRPDNRSSGYQGNRPDNRSNGYQGDRPDNRSTGGQGGGYRGGSSTGDRQGGTRPGPGRPFNRRPPIGGNNKPGVPPKKDPVVEPRKLANRKFFKAKKKEVYPKKKFQDHEEKILQIKKKAAAKANPIPKDISIMEVVTVSELARKMNLKAKQLIEKLMGLGMMVTINQQIDAATAALLANEYGCKVNIVSLFDETVIDQEKDEDEDLTTRPPIVTVMGHVDHGKTKLLDAIRTTNVVDKEFGGITQHIGAYTVDGGGKKIVFLDTPGHEAFTLMRARGAQITDIVVLVVAANDGVMPQTIEAINHAKEAKVPIIVAINKIDLPEANPEKVKQQLSDYGLMPEAWGGHTLYNEISALKKVGIKELLDSILLQTEMLELKANHKCRAVGKVIESKIDFGRGIVATVLIERGTLRVGDSFVAGVFHGKVRAMYNDTGAKISEVTPGLPAEIIGFTGIPEAGDPFQATESERMAKNVGVKRQELKKMEDAKNVKKVTLDNLYDKIKEGEVKELKVIIKGDVQGSVEALKVALEKLSTDEIRLNVISASAGAINEGDVNFASTSNAIIIGFHVRPTANAQSLADREKVEIKKYNIIYDVIEDIKGSMEGMLSPILQQILVGTAEVRQIFKVPKLGIIAGCYVKEGKIKRNSEIHVIREGIDIYKGKLTSLKRFKDDAKEVDKNYECGIGIEGCQDLKEGDTIEAFEIREITKKLDGESKNG